MRISFFQGNELVYCPVRIWAFGWKFFLIYNRKTGFLYNPKAKLFRVSKAWWGKGIIINIRNLQIDIMKEQDAEEFEKIADACTDEMARREDGEQDG